MANIQQGSTTTTSQAAEVIANTNSGYQFLDNSTSLMFQQSHFPNSIPQVLHIHWIYLLSLSIHNHT